MRNIKSIVVALVLLPIAANADLIWTGSISDSSEVDYFFFNSIGGETSFNVLAWSLNDTFLDSVIYILEDDGSPIGALTGSILGFNDDCADPVCFSDGSVSFVDSYISLVLTPGDYILAIMSWVPDPFAAITGFNFSGVTVGDYQITVDGISIPEPGALGLLGIGLFGIVLSRRRKRG